MAQPHPSSSIILITGANKGIGLAMAQHLLAQTAHSVHIILAARNVASIPALSATTKNTFSTLQLDVTSTESIAIATDSIESMLGRIDILINNASIVSTNTDKVSRLREVLETNVIGPFALTDAFKPLLLKPSAAQKRIINMTSDLGSVTARLDPNHKLFNSPFDEYRISKSALNMMSACAAHHLEQSGVIVTAFNPGFTATDLTGAGDNKERLKRGANSPDKVAQAIADLILEGKRDDERQYMVSVEGNMAW